MSVLGENTQCIFLDADVNADVVPHISTPRNMTGAKSVTLQLVTEERVSLQRQFDTINTDSVVAGSHTWTFANGAFLASDVGGLLVVNGTVSNDGIYVIATRTSATVITTGGVQVNETFPATAGRKPRIFVIPPGTLAGAWLIEAAMDYVGPQQGTYGQPTLGTEHWSDVTALFTVPGGGAIAAVVAATASTRKQFASCAVLNARVLRVTFTASAGSGRALALISGGNYSERL